MNTTGILCCLSLAAIFAFPIAGCAPAEKRQSTAEYFADGGITAKVRGAFARHLDRDAEEVVVDTREGEVQLSGTVAQADDVGRAAAVAGGIDGVKSVKNDIRVK